ncbi:hypothetical protein QWA_18377, partial [Alcaligenes faecalis subsp. faecalis NCIB 8687]
QEVQAAINAASNMLPNDLPGVALEAALIQERDGNYEEAGIIKPPSRTSSQIKGSF